MTSPNEFEQDKPGTAARSRAEAAVEDLRKRGGVFVDAVRATRMAMVLTDPNLPGNPIVFANQSFLDLSGYALEEVLGQQPYFMNGPDTAAGDAARFQDALERDRDEVVETVQYRKDGSRFIASLFLSAFKDDEGRTAHHFLSWYNVTRRVEAESDADAFRKAEAQLRESEQKYRLIVENARDYAIFIADPDGIIVDWREGAEAVFGWTAGEIVGRHLAMTFTPEDREKGEPQQEQAIARDEGKAPNVRWHMRKDGSRVFIEGVMTALRDQDGGLTGFLKIGRDATERRTGEERQKLLLAELQHRVRNIMAMMRSVARRTAETAGSAEDYAQHLEGRISTMARTQALLTRNIGAGVDLQNLLLDELDAQAAPQDKFTIDGPDLALSPKAAEVFTLAIHELATNATKYGALSQGEGRIDIKWDVDRSREGPDWLDLRWTESGVRLNGDPRREGFGTELITRRVPYELKGEGRMEFRETGVAAVIRFPLRPSESILQTDASAAGEGR